MKLNHITRSALALSAIAISALVLSLFATVPAADGATTPVKVALSCVMSEEYAIFSRALPSTASPVAPLAEQRQQWPPR